jgi:transcriptional regulator with XRE-family HTH domain
MARAGSAPQGEPQLIAILKESIRESGLSITELARRSNVSQAQLSRFLLGQRTLTLRSAAKLFDVLHLEVVKGRRGRRR